MATLRVPDVRLPEMDLGRLRVSIPAELSRHDLQAELSRLEAPAADLIRRVGRGKRTPEPDAVRPSSRAPVVVGLIVITGSVAFAVGLAWLFHPKLGPKRRRWLKRKLGMAPPQKRAGTRAWKDEPSRVALSVEADTQPVLG